MKLSVKGFITCKGAEMYSDCADNYAVNITLHKFSVSDGVSKSFFPKIWSRILVENYVEQETFDEQQLIKECQGKWQTEIDQIVNRPETKWFTRAEYNRKSPALATFVGLQLLEKEGKWIASALGDSFLFFVPKHFKDYSKELIKLSSKPEDKPIVFDNFPDYFSSIGNNHNGYPPLPIIKRTDLTEGTFYLMTDALAEWFLKNKENAPLLIDTWDEKKGQEDFERFISQKRQDGEISDDDSAILIIKLEDDKKAEITYIEKEVTDLKFLIEDEIIKIEEKRKKEIIEHEKQQEIAESIKEQEETVVNNELNSEINDEVQESQQTQNGGDPESAGHASFDQDGNEHDDENKPTESCVSTSDNVETPNIEHEGIQHGLNNTLTGRPEKPFEYSKPTSFGKKQQLPGKGGNKNQKGKKGIERFISIVKKF